MSSKTTNLNLHKIDLTDAPPDITVLNQNWDVLDERVHDLEVDSANHLPLEGGVLEGALTVKENFNVNKTYDGTEYKTYVRPVNYSIGNNGNYSTGLIHYQGSTNDSQLMFSRDGVMLRDNVVGKAYKLFGQHNTSDLITAVSGSGFARIATGTYKGNSSMDSSYVGSVSLTFPFAPKLIYIVQNSTNDYGHWGLWAIHNNSISVSAKAIMYHSTNYSNVEPTIASWNSSNLTLTLAYNPGFSASGNEARDFLNSSSETYYWVIVG